MRDLKKAQSIVEYAMVVALVGTLFVSIQNYLQRGIRAHIKNTADTFGIQQEWRDHDDGSAEFSDSYYHGKGKKTTQEFPNGFLTDKHAILETGEDYSNTSSVSITSVEVGY